MSTSKLLFLLFGIGLALTGCELNSNPDDSYFPCGSGYEWTYILDRNTTIKVELGEEYSNGNRRVYRNYSYVFGYNGWQSCPFSFPDVGYLWGRDEDSVYYYHDNDRFSFSLWPDEGDTIIATSRSMPLVVGYEEDSLILKYDYTTQSGEEIRDGSYRIVRTKGIGIVSIIDTVTFQGEYRSHSSYILEYFATPDSVIYP